jgi:hypothetical protein
MLLTRIRLAPRAAMEWTGREGITGERMGESPRPDSDPLAEEQPSGRRRRQAPSRQFAGGCLVGITAVGIPLAALVLSG